MANIFMRFPGGKKKAMPLSYDDGTEQDRRLISIMQKHGLKGTFNISTGILAKEGTVYAPGTIHRRLSASGLSDTYGDSGMEVAAHGHTHAYLNQLPAGLCLEEVIRNREGLEAIFPVIVRGMAYPHGAHGEETRSLLSMAGIAYARTTVSSETFAIPQDWMRWNPTCHHNNPRLMELAKRFVEEPVKKAPALFYLWGHSFEFDRDQNWEVIEAFAALAGDKKEIWYATNLQIYDYVQAYRQLIFSMDGKRIYNPTAQELWLEAHHREICLKGGAMTELQETPVETAGLETTF